MNKIPMTADGFAKLQNELKKLISEDRPNIIASIAEARGHGDLSENAEYQYAKEQQSLTEGRISDLESFISRAEIIDIKAVSGDDIKFGATIEIEDDDTGNKQSYQIVGEYESDIEKKKLSIIKMHGSKYTISQLCICLNFFILIQLLKDSQVF